MEWDPDAWWYKHVPEDDVADAIFDALNETDEAMSVSDLCEITGEKPTKVRGVANDLVKAGRLKSMSSTSNGKGSTGLRYRMPFNDNAGGLSV